MLKASIQLFSYDLLNLLSPNRTKQRSYRIGCNSVYDV